MGLKKEKEKTKNDEATPTQPPSKKRDWLNEDAWQPTTLIKKCRMRVWFNILTMQKFPRLSNRSYMRHIVKYKNLELKSINFTNTHPAM